MLAQTQVARAAPRFSELLDRFPTPRACAEAPVGDVIRLWTGLGYNRRAVSLHRAARIIVERHAGEVPSSLADLLALPGVGPYTARAVLATAFEHRAAVVDTNVGRVLARAVSAKPLGSGEAQRLADSLVPIGASRDWNLALMDFGSLVCCSRQPHCGLCPVAERGACAWRRSGADEATDPAAGSAGVTGRQSRFAGSDREGRGKLVRAACAGPVPVEELAAIAGWPEDGERASRVAGSLVAEGILVEVDGELRLP
ncbi:MAG: A/G-specific adenine glycosylase [Acidimicrobiaceae bacterium]|nr:A/G-specific adenine glycosylase [Acidimicrobiaceae bacterium]